jgi:glycosyltransferase involved in cell wall biosynthesis
LSVDESEGEDLARLERHGWSVLRAGDVTATPAEYRAYVEGSAGEFSCAKPSCMRLQNSWVSDRTICYLASGRPAVVQNTGPSAYLDGGQGLLRFSTIDEAAQALIEVHAHYAAHCAAARELAVAHFDARKVVGEILDVALGAGDRAAGSAAG